VRAPWYQWVGFDFVSEVLLPGKLTDHKTYEFDLQPERVVPGQEIVARAAQFRDTAHADGVPRISGTPPTGWLMPPAHGGAPVHSGESDFAPIVPPATIFTQPAF